MNKKRKYILYSVLSVFFIAIVIIFMVIFNREKKVLITQSELPDTASVFIKKYFPGIPVDYIIKDIDGFKVTYKTKFLNGMKIEFDSSGNWKEIDGKRLSIPIEVVPLEIAKYISTHFVNTNILKIEKKVFKQEVEISNGLDLIFNNSGSFIKIDD